MTSFDLTTIGISTASLIVSLTAAQIARGSHFLAKQVAERDHVDWKQRKWFDLYLKANEAYDFFDFFQKKYPSTSSPYWNTIEWENDWAKLILLMREANAMATVFPVNPVVDQLAKATAALNDYEEAVSKSRLQLVFDAVDNIRIKAQIKDLLILD